MASKVCFPELKRRRSGGYLSAIHSVLLQNKMLPFSSSDLPFLPEWGTLDVHSGGDSSFPVSLKLLFLTFWWHHKRILSKHSFHGFKITYKCATCILNLWQGVSHKTIKMCKNHARLMLHLLTVIMPPTDWCAVGQNHLRDITVATEKSYSHYSWRWRLGLNDRHNLCNDCHGSPVCSYRTFLWIWHIF